MLDRTPTNAPPSSPPPEGIAPPPAQQDRGLADRFRDLLASESPWPSAHLDPPPPPIGWAILDLLGHRRELGYLSEEKIAGVRFLRLDTPHFDAEGELDGNDPKYFSTNAVYAITPASEKTIRDELSPWIACNEPVSVQVEGSDDAEAGPCSLRRGHDGDHDPDLLSDLPF